VSEELTQPKMLSLDGGNTQPLSVRARALVFSDPLSEKLLEDVERIAPSEAPVLIGGETGTGKELIARHIHLLSKRHGPFLAVNCGAINEELVESELFGHEAGSFTGATGKRIGWFEAANEGTLFLDEIGDLPLSMQVKLLRVLQEREVVRIGSRTPIPINVRLITATNINLQLAVSAGSFRSDLLYRINIAYVRLPPLRERPGDILPLANYFINTYGDRIGYDKPEFSSRAIKLLLDYSWPGNIRELENVVHFALLVAADGYIDVEHLRVKGGWKAIGFETHSPELFSTPVQQTAEIETVEDEPLEIISNQLLRLFSLPNGKSHLDEFEKLVVKEAFNHANQNQIHASALLGITRNVMRTLLRRHGLLREIYSYNRRSSTDVKNT
jgi:DNA-binding NtrC family response regulator